MIHNAASLKVKKDSDTERKIIAILKKCSDFQFEMHETPKFLKIPDLNYYICRSSRKNEFCDANAFDELCEFLKKLPLEIIDFNFNYDVDKNTHIQHMNIYYSYGSRKVRELFKNEPENNILSPNIKRMNIDYAVDEDRRLLIYTTKSKKKNYFVSDHYDIIVEISYGYSSQKLAGSLAITKENPQEAYILTSLNFDTWLGTKFSIPFVSLEDTKNKIKQEYEKKGYTVNAIEFTPVKFHNQK